MKKPEKTTHANKFEAIRLSETSDESQAQIEQDPGISSGCLCRWKQEFAEEGEYVFPGNGRLTSEREEIRQMKRKIEILRQERDVPKKAVAIFTHPSK